MVFMSNDIISSNAIVGYARTSSVEQIAGLEDQICELKAAGCTNIYSEQISSVDANRDRLRELYYFSEAEMSLFSQSQIGLLEIRPNSSV